MAGGDRCSWTGAIAAAALCACWSTPAARAEDEPPPPATPIGQFLTVTAPIDDQVLARVTQVATDLATRAERESRPAVLVLEIRPGTSAFHHVQALTRFLTSSSIGGLRTVAWIPETVTGPNVLVALSCREIVMHPDAELGDLGRGQPVEPEDQQIALAVAQKRTNPKVNTALVRAMFDPQEQLWRVRLRTGEGDAATTETRPVTRAELDALRAAGVVIDSAEIIKETGAIGVFKGSTARGLEVLVEQAAENRPAVAELYNLPRDALREPRAGRPTQRVRLIKLDGEINTLQESFLERQIRRALHSGAEVLVFQIDSHGGELLASLNLAQAIADLDPQRVRTVAFIPHQALSGAAIIALGCDEIYMHPAAKLGDAGPLEIRPGGPIERAPEKVLSYLRSALQTLAEKKGRPVALAEAMADRSLKVFQATHRETGRVWYKSEAELQAAAGEWVAGPQVREANGELLLTVDGRRAHELLLAERPVHDLEEVKVRLGLPAGMKLGAVERTWVDSLVFLLNRPAMTVLLFVIGIACLYLELHFPTSLLGIASVLCFALFFWSRFLGGTADWLELILFALGLGCIALEAFVIPGFGVFGVTGILLVIGAIVMASQTFGNLEPNADLYQLGRNLGTFSLSVAAVIVLAVALGRFLPHVPFLEGIILAPPGAPASGPRLRMGTDLPEANAAALVGRRGEALSLLRPAGKARLDGRVIDVVSDGPFIPAGSPIEIITAVGNRIVVRQV